MYYKLHTPKYHRFNLSEDTALVNGTSISFPKGRKNKKDDFIT